MGITVEIKCDNCGMTAPSQAIDVQSNEIPGVWGQMVYVDDNFAVPEQWSISARGHCLCDQCGAGAATAD
jgi:hypothetical protein